jgi:6-phosphogluconolactonase (cycloisomerase 2 family)
MKHFRTSTGEATAGGHALSQDGSNLYVVGTTRDTINQYTLSTPWDIGTTGNVVVSSANIFVTDGAPIEMRFNPEGNVMIVLGENTDFLHTFNLGIPWMVSTAIKANTHSANAFGEALPKDFFINPEGNVLILYGQTKKSPVRIPLNESWNLASASNAGVTFGSANFETFEATPTTIDFNPSGKIAYIGGTTNDRIFPVFLANSYYDTRTADYGFPVRPMGINSVEGDFVWSNTGSSLFVMSNGSTNNGAVIKQFSAKVPYDLYSIDIGFDCNNPQLIIQNLETNPYNLAISDDNQYLYVVGANENLYRIQFKDPYNPSLSNVTLPIKNLLKDQVTTLTPSYIKVLPNGNIIVGIHTIGGAGSSTFPSAGFYDYPAPINANVSDISYTYSNVYNSTSANDTLPTAITFVNNGNVAFITGETSNDVTQHLLSEAYNIATARRSTDAANTYTEINFSDIGGLETSQDGRYIFATEKSSTNGRVWRVEMLTPNVIANTSIYNRQGGSVFNISPWNGPITTDQDNFDFNEDGTKLFYLPSNPYDKNMGIGVLASSEITQFNLATPYDVALMSNSGISANTSHFNVYYARDMKFSRNGKCLYITQTENQTDYYITQAYLIERDTLG